MFGLHARARLLAQGARARQALDFLSSVVRTKTSATAIAAKLPTSALRRLAHSLSPIRFMATDADDALPVVDFEDDDLDGATAAEAITQAIAPTPWKSVVELPPKLRELIVKETGDFSSTQLHYMFTEMCRELAERTATNLTQHHPESPESRAGAAIYLPPFVYSPTYTLAFTAYRAPIQFSILQRVMAEISTRRPDFTPKRVLDFGAGCGMAAWALDNVWPGETQAYTAIEPSRSMVDMAHKLLQDFPGVKFEGSITKFLEHNSIRRHGERAAGVAKKAAAFDMSIGSFLLGELTSDNARAAATKILFDQLRPGGFAVFAEPATPWGLRCVDSARQFLLANYSTTDSRNLGTAEVLAPWIPWEAAPLSSSEAKLCTFPQGRPVGIYTPSRRAKHSSTGRTQFVYLVVQKQRGSTHDLITAKSAASVQDATDQVVSKQWAADFIDQECGMIVGHPLKKKKHVHLYICDKHGKLHKRTVTKRRHGKGERKAWYRAARKASWGGYWPLSEDLPVRVE